MKYIVGLLIVLLPHIAQLRAQQNRVVIDIIPVAGNVHMLTGQGGNIGLSIGKDGIFMIDDQFAPLSEQIKQAIKEVSPSQIKFLLNTHWHGDHVGGNQNFSQDGTVIVAHKNVRNRMSSEQFIELFKRKVKPSPEAALPVITFSTDLSFHFNGESAEVLHMPHGHTDGDSIIWFKTSDVIHMGDLYFEGRFPFIDLSSGGSIDGMINAVNWVLENAGRNTRIIPGHGSVSTMEQLLAYRNMLVEARSLVQQAINRGENLTTTKTKKVLNTLSKKWGVGFIKEDAFVEMIFKSLQNR